MTLKFDIGWLPAPGVRDPAEAATWAEFSLRLDGQTVSRVLDERLNSGRSTYCGSALPLAEWLVDVWPRLVHERRVPVPLQCALTSRVDGSSGPAVVRRGDFFEWVGYHSLRASREGGASPDLRLARFDGGSFVVRMNADAGPLAPGMSVRFLMEADARVAAPELKSELHRVVEAVTTRLAPIKTERVQRLLARWSLSQSDAAAVSGRLGADDELLSQEERAVVAGLVGDPSRELLLGVAEGSAASSVAERISEARTVKEAVPEAAPAGKMWLHLEDALAKVRLDRPWLTGWAAASEFRTASGLGAEETPAKRLGRLLAEVCGWPEQAQLFPLKTAPTGVETVHVKGTNKLPVVMTATRTPQAHRFRLARSLYYFLFLEGRGERAVSDSHMVQGRLSEANAFAAELLAPAAVIRSRVPKNGVWTVKQVKSLAVELGVDQRVVAHQIENRDLGVAA